MILLSICLTLLKLPHTNGLTKREIQLQRVEQIGGENLLDSSGLRVRKYNRTTATLNGTLIFLEDIDQTYEICIKSARSALGNNQFNEYPMKIARKHACQFFRDLWPEYQHWWQNISNIPLVEEGSEGFCPLPKGVYWIKDLTMEASFIPLVTPAGYWRFSWEFYHSTGELVLQVRFFFHLNVELTF